MSAGDWPNVLVVGAPKCGTTSFHVYLGQHPEVFTTQQKELHFFSQKCLLANANGPGDKYALRDMAQSTEDYLAHYASAHERIRADVSPSYLYYDETAAGIRSSCPDARAIVLIRDPVEKAYSQYLHLVRDQREWLTFEEALDAEPKRIEEGWSDMWRYVDSSRYASHIFTFQEILGTERVLVLTSGELNSDPSNVMRSVWHFLGVDESFGVDKPETRNNSTVMRSQGLWNALARRTRVRTSIEKMIPEEWQAKFISSMRKLNTQHKQGISEQTRSRLRSDFRDEESKLEAILQRKLPWTQS